MIKITLFGITTLVSFEQRANALIPILVTPLPIVRLVRLVQPAKVPPRIVVTLPGIVTLVSGVSMNASSPTLVTLLGIVTPVKPLVENASGPMLVTPLEIV